MYTLEQQKAHRKLWVEALRSGKYQQGKELLHWEGRFCCLGVACAIYGVSTDEMAEHPNLARFRDVRDFFGLRDEIGTFDDGSDILPCLASKNDDGKTFTEIADIVESEPKGLFAESDEQ